MIGGLVIEINGVNEVILKLKGSVSRSQNLTIPMKQGALMMMSSVNQNFMAGGRPRWPSLNIKTRAQKLKKGYSLQPLIRSGYLRGSITPKVDSKGFKLGTSVVYARIQQKGGFAGRKHSAYIPARPYLKFQKSDITEINKLVKAYITKGA